MSKKLFLLDGHALVYRAHFAFITRPLMNSKGWNVSAIQGFMRTMWDMMQTEKPSHIAVMFDPRGGTFRRMSNTSPTKPTASTALEDISFAIPWIIKILKAMRVPIVTVDNYEADDVIGTIAKQAEKEGFTTYMERPTKISGNW